MARRLAAVGYFVLLPNLYYRRSRDYWLKERTEPAMAPFQERVAAAGPKPPEIPFVSSATGTWLGAKEAGEGSLAGFLPALTNAVYDAVGLRLS